MSTPGRRIRSKDGHLELYKGGQWKKYLFKVSGSTYFHYFGTKDVGKAKHEILLSSIKSVEPSAKIPKGGYSHVFEVKFSGKGSPWVIKASSQEEQMSWMEAIKPGSSAILTQYSRKAQLSPQTAVASGRVSPVPPARISPVPSMETQPNQGVQSIPGYSQGAQATPGYPQGVQATSGYSPGVQATSEYSPGVQAMSGYSPGVQTMPGYSPGVQAMPGYSPGMQRSPVSPHHAQPNSSYFSPGQPQPGLSPVSPAMNGHPAGAQMTAGYPSPPHMNAGGVSQDRMPYATGKGYNGPPFSKAAKKTAAFDEFQLPRSSNPYVAEPYLDPALMSNTVSPPPPQDQGPVGSRAHHSASFHGTSSTQYPPSVHDPTSSLPASMTTGERIHPGLRRSSTEKFASNLDSKFRNPIVPPRPKETLPPEQEDYTDMSGEQDVAPDPDDDQESAYKGVAELLMQQFTSDQLGMLRDMLDKMAVGSGSMDKSLGYMMSKTAMNVKETMLVTDDDDPDSYDQRPLWAKAVVNESVPGDDDDDLEGELSNLEHRVCNIPCSELSGMVKIGAGQFGEVFRAHYCQDGCVGESITVAVKKTKDDCPENEKQSILKEMEVMSKMVHPNIVKLYGVVTQDVPAPWVVLEFLPYGDLRNYLVTHPRRTNEQLVKYMVDVTMGMHYLAERNLVHRDLAARNVLVGEGELCKVADFGLMRELPKDESIYQSTSNLPCPVRWMAPECITHRRYSLASDVWAFGILQWEMYNPTKKVPYPGIDNLQVALKVSKDNYRMPLPRGCPPIVARVMKACWHSDPKRRPSFRLITTLLTTRGLRSKQPADKPRAPDPPEVYI